MTDLMMIFVVQYRWRHKVDDESKSESGEIRSLPLAKVTASSFGFGVKLCDNVDVDTRN